jgi:putative endonuclease
MFYVYVLQLETRGNKSFYIGYSSNLKRRLSEHLKNYVKSTKNRRPRLLYYEAYDNKYKALLREKNIKKSGSVYVSLMKRIRSSREGSYCVVPN